MVAIHNWPENCVCWKKVLLLKQLQKKSVSLQAEQCWIAQLALGRELAESHNRPHIFIPVSFMTSTRSSVWIFVWRSLATWLLQNVYGFNVYGIVKWTVDLHKWSLVALYEKNSLRDEQPFSGQPCLSLFVFFFVWLLGKGPCQSLVPPRNYKLVSVGKARPSNSQCLKACLYNGQWLADRNFKTVAEFDCMFLTALRGNLAGGQRAPVWTGLTFDPLNKLSAFINGINFIDSGSSYYGNATAAPGRFPWVVWYGKAPVDPPPSTNRYISDKYKFFAKYKPEMFCLCQGETETDAFFRISDVVPISIRS